MQIQKVERYVSDLIRNTLAPHVGRWTDREVFEAFGVSHLLYRPSEQNGVYVVSIGPWTNLGQAKEKPRMWWCPRERLYMCQRGFVRGKGTTREWAYKQMKERLNEHC